MKDYSSSNALYPVRSPQNLSHCLQAFHFGGFQKALLLKGLKLFFERPWQCAIFKLCCHFLIAYVPRGSSLAVFSRGLLIILHVWHVLVCPYEAVSTGTHMYPVVIMFGSSGQLLSLSASQGVYGGFCDI
jgi:hypothetical protein